MKARASQEGFTLIEVLVALTIVAVALAACVRATGVMAANNASLRDRSLAMLSAQNTLAELRAQRIYPSVGNQSAACPQGTLRLICERTVAGTANNGFREVTVRVRAEPAGAALAELRGLVTAWP